MGRHFIWSDPIKVLLIFLCGERLIDLFFFFTFFYCMCRSDLLDPCRIASLSLRAKNSCKRNVMVSVHRFILSLLFLIRLSEFCSYNLYSCFLTTSLNSAVVICVLDRPGLRGPDLVEKLHASINRCLQIQMKVNHNDDPSVLAKLVIKVSELRLLNTVHSEKLLGVFYGAPSVVM